MISLAASRFAAAGAAALSLAGCALQLEVPAEVPRRHELTDVPFFPQSEFDCGPAALASILAFEGVPVTADDLLEEVYVEGLRGSLQAELMAGARRHERIPYRIEPDLQDLLTELAAGRPVLVLQNLGLPRLPIWHYAVVVGFDADRGRLVLRSGTERRRLVSVRRFVNTWRRADNWGIVALRPGSLPETATPAAYTRALVEAERLLGGDAVRAAYASALARWPHDGSVLFAAASRSHGEHRLEEAERLYRQLLAERPGHAAARNNLAHVLIERGCAAEALDQARAALAAAQPGDLFYAEIEDTVAEIGRRAERRGVPLSAECR